MTNTRRLLPFYLSIVALAIAGSALPSYSMDVYGPWYLGIVAMVLFIAQGVLMGLGWRRR